MRTDEILYDLLSGFGMPVVNGADLGSSLTAMSWAGVILASLMLIASLIAIAIIVLLLWQAATAEQSNTCDGSQWDQAKSE
jgi:hypothetical protein